MHIQAHPDNNLRCSVAGPKIKMVEGELHNCSFEKLLSRNLPHVLQKIFLYLDYESFKACHKVNKTWNSLITSKSFQKKARFIFKVGIEQDVERLINACWSNNIHEVACILSTGFVSVDCEGPDGATSLCVAVCHSSNDVVNLLIQRCADPNKPINKKWMGKRGVTPLISAADNLEGAKLLLQAGAKPNTADESGNTPLHGASLRGNQEMVELLMDRGANPNVMDVNGKTPLHVAAKNGHLDVAQLLIKKGADLNKPDNKGRTPLFDAGYTRLMSLLLEAGAVAAFCCTSGKNNPGPKMSDCSSISYDDDDVI